MSTRRKFLEQAKDTYAVLHVPNDSGSTVTIPLKPEHGSRGRLCRWQGRDTVLVSIDGIVYEAKVVFNITIPVSRKWGTA